MKTSPHYRTASLLSLVILSSSGWVAGQQPGFPGLNLKSEARGSGIITALGSRLPEVAKFYGMSAADFGALCLRDKDLRSDKAGRLHYICEGNTAQAPTAQYAGTNALLSYPSSETFLLHSKPGATRVIYLDFNGHTTSGTSWKSGATFTSPAYDTDGNAAAFSAGELASIQEIWKRVSEDYAPWDVDVTTAEPPLESLRKTTTGDTAYGVRMVIGGSSYDWYGAGAGGVAYVGSFSWNSDTPAFVFPAQLGNGYAKYVAEAVSHEAGHTVGLSHDGVSGGATYYQGHNGWAPIMGVGYYAGITQFSKGEYTGANNTQDDTTIINGYIPRSLDLAGNDILSAVPLTGTSVSATGIIESSTDADLYKISAGTGTVTFSANTASPDANLDITLALYDGAGNLLTSSNPATLTSTLSTTVTEGTYYLSVEGTGVGTGSTGYTDYASIGQFSLTGTVPASIGAPPAAVASQTTPLSGTGPLTVNFSSAGSSDPEGSALTYDWDFGDNTASTEANPVHTYTEAGTYTASLVVFDATGLSASTTVSITVNGNQAPVAAASQTAGTGPLTVNFSSTGSSDPEGSALSFAWDFGDGTTSTDASPSHTYAAAGTYTASLTVTDAAGLTGSTTLSVTVTDNLPPVADASQTTPTAGTGPLTVNFSSTGSSDPEGSALTFSWNFGDGITSTEASPSHTYSAAGTYTASLTVADPDGLTGSTAVVITVADPQITIYVADITMSKNVTTSGTSARAVVTIKDTTGKLIPGATVTGSWSGLTKSSSTSVTGTAGTATFNSQATKKSGTFTFTVTGVSLAGATYNAALNTVTRASIVK